MRLWGTCEASHTFLTSFGSAAALSLQPSGSRRPPRTIDRNLNERHVNAIDLGNTRHFDPFALFPHLAVFGGPWRLRGRRWRRFCRFSQSTGGSSQGAGERNAFTGLIQPHSGTPASTGAGHASGYCAEHTAGPASRHTTFDGAVDSTGPSADSSTRSHSSRHQQRSPFPCAGGRVRGRARCQAIGSRGFRSNDRVRDRALSGQI